ncbi:hypothetical protein BFP72_09160 [Reichenbachiella sp. 5M10]|uniref:hypothetical protein n=1 Tax=Reichenbachiella sp. 5M10 TaxID=1889772 RepID=UPI000C15B639|nr:hypothetical protein [Reichenbachiella sp. 5M10]PIB35546.1 hypothetical protein BFP72_09160 [Reichenbachiella sp. 5M10]
MSKTTPLSHLELALSGPILYLLPDESGQHLVVEFLADDLPVFYWIDLHQKAITKELHVASEYKNIVLHSFSEDYILTQRFSDQNNPNSVEIFKFEWNNPEPTFVQIDSQILTHGAGWIETPHPHFQGKTVFIDLTTGRSTDKTLPASPYETSHVQFPVAYSDQSQYFDWFEKLLVKNDHTPVKSCEYLKHKDTLVLSYYVIENKKLLNYLLIMNQKGEALDRFLLAGGLKGIGKDTFFLTHNQLIFVTDKHILNVIEL